MAERKTKEEDMDPLNVDLPKDTILMLRLAKALTGKSIRKIVLEALGSWLKSNGVTEDKLNKLRR